MSTLPEIGETAIVEITYTNLFANLTAEAIASGHDGFKIGWTVGAGFEIVDNGGNVPVKRVWHPDDPLVLTYLEFLPLNYGESKTYRIEVRAVDAGIGFIANQGYLGSGSTLYLYLDQDETLPLQEHRSRYPEMHQRSTVQPAPQPPFPREDVEYVPPSRELLSDFFEAYFAGSDPEEIGAAMDFVQITGWHLNYTLPDLKQILGYAGYTDKEIEAEWSSRASTQSSTRNHLPYFLVNGWLQNDQITLGVGKTNLVNSAEVCAYVTNQVTKMIVAMGCADTNQYGVFSLNSSRVDIIRSDPVDIEIIIKSKGEHAIVRNTNTHIIGKVINTSSSVHGLGYFVNAPINETDGDLRNALWIVDSISDTHDYFTDRGITVPQVTVNWESGVSPDAFPNKTGPDGTHYDPNNM